MTDAHPTVKVYTGEQVSVTFEASLCRHAAKCVHGLPHVFDTSARPWIQPDNAAPDEVVKTVESCPTGALQYQLRGASHSEPNAPAAGPTG